MIATVPRGPPRARTPWLRYAWQLLVLVACVCAGRQLDSVAIVAAAKAVPTSWLALGALCAFINLFAKGTAWWLLLAPAGRPSWLGLSGIHLKSAASSIVLPLRAGEGLRIWWLKERYGLLPSKLVGLALAEKLLNMSSLALMVGVSATQLTHRPPWLLKAWLVLATVAGAIGMVAVGVWRLPHARAARERLSRAVPSAPAGRWLVAFLGCLCGWLADSLLVWLMATGAEVPLPAFAAPIVLLAINVAIALPSTPGHVGTMELASSTALQAFGAEPARAVGFALLYHAVQVVPVLLLAAAVGFVGRLRPVRRPVPRA